MSKSTTSAIPAPVRQAPPTLAVRFKVRGGELYELNPAQTAELLRSLVDPKGA